MTLVTDRVHSAMVPGDVARRRLRNHVSFFQPEKSPPSRTPKHTDSTQTVESASLMTWSSRWDRAESEASGNLPINSSMQVDTFIKKQLSQSCYEDHHAIKMFISAVKFGHFDTAVLLAVGGFLVLFGFIFKLQRFPIVFYIQSVPTATQTRTGVAHITSCSTYFWVCLQVTLDGSSKQTWIFTDALPHLVYCAEVLLVALLLHEHLRHF